MGVSLGGLAFTNMWDLPTYAMLLVGVAAIKAYPSQDSTGFGYVKRAALAIVQVPLVVVLLAVVLYLPYYLSFTSSVQGVGAVITPTRYVHMLVVLGVPMALGRAVHNWELLADRRRPGLAKNDRDLRIDRADPVRRLARSAPSDSRPRDVRRPIG